MPTEASDGYLRYVRQGGDGTHCPTTGDRLHRRVRTLPLPHRPFSGSPRLFDQESLGPFLVTPQAAPHFRETFKQPPGHPRGPVVVFDKDAPARFSTAVEADSLKAHLGGDADSCDAEFIGLPALLFLFPAGLYSHGFDQSKVNGFC